MTWVAAAPPTLTVAPLSKLVPPSVSCVPPKADPSAGETTVRVGAFVAAACGHQEEKCQSPTPHPESIQSDASGAGLPAGSA